MSVTEQRRIVDFIEDGVNCARAGVLPEALDDLIYRLAEEGLLDELTRHRWVRQPAPWALDRGSKPKKGCLSSFVRILGRRP